MSLFYCLAGVGAEAAKEVNGIVKFTFPSAKAFSEGKSSSSTLSEEELST